MKVRVFQHRLQRPSDTREQQFCRISIVYMIFISALYVLIKGKLHLDGKISLMNLGMKLVRSVYTDLRKPESSKNKTLRNVERLRLQKRVLLNVLAAPALHSL